MSTAPGPWVKWADKSYKDFGTPFLVLLKEMGDVLDKIYIVVWTKLYASFQDCLVLRTSRTIYEYQNKPGSCSVLALEGGLAPNTQPSTAAQWVSQCCSNFWLRTRAWTIEMEMQEDEEGANYSYDIPIDELLDSVSGGEKEPVEEKPGVGSVPHQLDEPQEVVVNHEPGSYKVTRRMEGSPKNTKFRTFVIYRGRGGGGGSCWLQCFFQILFLLKNHLYHSWTTKRMFSLISRVLH